jgi:glycosyltransferase involved in cell wall biosynthesis
VKILWCSNAPWTGTGYGQQTAQVVRRLAADGHDVAVAANYGLHGQVMDWEGIPVYPGGYETYSNDVLGAHAEHFGADWVVTLMDAWVLKAPALQRLNVASWTPVDHVPTPPRVVKYFKDYGAVPVAMSEFGHRMLTGEGLSPAYIPHAVDTNVYRQVEDAKARMGLSGFVVGMVAANKGSSPCRKGFPEAFMAFSRFHKDHPDSVLYVHSDPDGRFHGVDLHYLATSCDIPSEALMFTDPDLLDRGMPAELMAPLYSSFDVLLAPSLGEGFGLPVIEAQACGTPVIVTDWTAQPELVGGGWCVDGQPFWDEEQKAWFSVPSVRGLVNALEASTTADMRVLARKKALEYDADTVYTERWKPFLAQLAERIPTAEPIR